MSDATDPTPATPATGPTDATGTTEATGSAPGKNPRLGWRGWWRWGWRTLTSMRTALWLLALLALAAIPGSLLPQRPTDPAAVLRYQREHPGLSQWWQRLGWFDVFGSVWFQAVYLLLLGCLLGCVLPRGKRWLQQLRQPPSVPTERGLQAAAQHHLQCDLTPEDALAKARKWLSSKRFRLYLAPESPQRQTSTWLLCADKGRLRELGNQLFHLALLAILVAVALGHHYGYRAQVVVVEGEGFANSVAQFDSYQPGAGVQADELAPFSVQLRQLQVNFDNEGPQAGLPEGFAALVGVREHPGAPVREVKIGPNAPLNVQGTKVFLMGQGYAPRVSVRDGQGRLVFSGPVVLLPNEGDRNLTSPGVLKVPDALPEQLGLRLTFLPTGLRLPTADGGFQLVSVAPQADRPVLVVESAWRGNLGLEQGAPQSVYRLDTTRMRPVETAPDQPLTAELTLGTTLALPDGLGSLTFDGYSRFAGFSLSKDPGRWAALASAMLALLGLMISLFVHPRTVWVQVSRLTRTGGQGSDSGSAVVLSGQTARGSEQLRHDLQKLAVWLGEDGSTSPFDAQKSPAVSKYE